MERDGKAGRDYRTTALPTLQPDTMKSTAEVSRCDTILMKIYDQSVQNWRELLSVRFKLLALVPTVSVLALAAVLSSEGWGKGLAPLHKLTLTVLGLVITLALFAYDMRNSVLYADLMRRAAKVEEELGVETGVFLGRLNPTGIVTHGLATNTIYISSCVAWVMAIASLVPALCACR